MNTTYLTVAIPYVNAEPHLGYAYELVLADIHARARRLGGDDVRFLGGTDDHSLKNVLAAEQAGVPIEDFVNGHARRFEDLREPLGLSFDDFIRTSADPRHVPAVHRLWSAARASGDLYKQAYEGDYCVGCERFYTADEVEDGACPEHERPLERVAEDNWFFRLSRYQHQIEELLASDTIHISPEPFRNEALSFVRAGLADISVSRSIGRSRGWGVPVPEDPTQVVYVWFDALANYISALGFGRPGAGAYDTWWVRSDRRTHVIGKGILRFHAVYWPAFLLSAGQRLPTHIRVHPYLTSSQLKLSKSTGTRIDPTHVATTCGTDRLRWWFARDVSETADTDFTLDRLVARANDDLAGGIGNVISRIVNLVHRFRDGSPPDGCAAPLDAVVSLPRRVRERILAFELRDAAAQIVDAVAVLNQDLERTAPWKLAEQPGARRELDVLLARHLATARVIVDALEPIAPALATEARTRLTGTPRLPEPSPLIGRIELPVDEHA